LIVRWIDPDLAEVEWTRVDRARARPVFAAIFRAKHTTGAAAQFVDVAGAAFEALHDRHHDIRFARGNGETDAAGLRDHAVRQFFPCRSTIRALENSTDIFAIR